MSKGSCLIIERHDWETGAFRHQLQIPLTIANEFFGSATSDRDVCVRVFMPASARAPAFEQPITISRKYAKSATRRVNRFHQIGSIPSSFIFFQETGSPGTYDLWWQTDKAVVAARYHPWYQAQGSQYGRGRLAIIVAAPVPRPVTEI
jgi:hypothetical protein